MIGLGQANLFLLEFFHLVEYEKSRFGSWIRDFWLVGA